MQRKSGVLIIKPCCEIDYPFSVSNEKVSNVKIKANKILFDNFFIIFHVITV